MIDTTTTPGKVRIEGAEAALIVEGLGALAREYTRLADDAQRLGYSDEAAGFARIARKASEARSLYEAGSSVSISRITVRHS